ncbi:MAG: response regulator [Bacteroidota bacterium]|nr:response regulator [Bacteroidota bacterium]
MESILLIEDNRDFLENLIEFLELEGYHILSANNEETGIELARKFIPNLIICDHPNPGVNGHEVLRTLTNSASTSGIPFIISTTLSGKKDRSDALELGADDYIIKPYDLGMILAMAKNWLKTGSKRQTYIS